MNDKEKLISLLILTDPNPYTCESKSGSCELTTCTECRARSTADLLIANGVTVQEWISVDDRLPEEDGNYIVCCDDSSCSYGEGIWYSSDVVVVSEYYEGSWIWYEGGTEWSLENIVTHWMPLPQPPKGE